MTQSNKSGYEIALSTGQWKVVNRLLTVIFLVDSNPPFGQLGPYTALEAHYKPLLPRRSQRQTMNRGETKKTTWEGPRERSLRLGTSSTVFLFNLGQAVLAAALFLHLFTKHERNTHQKSLPATYQPFAHFATILQRRVKSGYKLTFFVARPSDLISWSEILSGQWTPWLPFRSVRQQTAFSNFSFWLVITIVHFVFREEIQVNQNTKTSRDFLAWNSWKLTSWACYRGCCAKGKKSWRCCLVGKYVRYTKMTPVIYFAPQTLNNKEFYYANLIFQKRELS